MFTSLMMPAIGRQKCFETLAAQQCRNGLLVLRFHVKREPGQGLIVLRMHTRLRILTLASQGRSRNVAPPSNDDFCLSESSTVTQSHQPKGLNGCPSDKPDAIRAPVCDQACWLDKPSAPFDLPETVVNACTQRTDLQSRAVYRQILPASAARL